MRKKLFTLLLAVAASVGTTFAVKVQIGDLYYNLDATNHTAEVTYQNSIYPRWSTTITTANIPASVTDNSVSYSVTRIGKEAFLDCSGLTSVTIPNSVTSIGEWAFSDCTGLTSVTIPNSVNSIGRGAFAGCTGFTSVEIPNSVTSIGVETFRWCTGLTSVTIPNSVTSIGDGAFAYCTGLTSINVASDNSNYCSVDGVLFNKNRTTLISYPGGKQGAYSIPNSVTSIGGGAFAGCRLTSVTIPNSVTSIGICAFEGCSSLTSVTIPNSVTSIGNYAFFACSGLTSPVYNAHVFAYMPTSYSGAYTIPDGIESIAGGAFRDCTGLTSVTIPNSVTSIGSDDFLGCTGLKNVILGTSVKVLDAAAFASCSSIETITCYGQRPPTVNQNALYGLDYSTIVYVPADYLETYKMHDAWGLYDVRPLGAKSTETTDVNVTPAENTADVAWPAVSGAATYELVIKDKSGNVICTLIFNANGQLTSIAFAPSRNGAPQQTQAAGFSFTVTGLESGTSYDLTITSKDNSGTTLDTKTISFTTSGEAPLGIDQVPSDQVQSTKVIKNGQILILRGDKTYTVTGQEVK